MKKKRKIKRVITREMKEKKKGFRKKENRRRKTRGRKA